MCFIPEDSITRNILFNTNIHRTGIELSIHVNSICCVPWRGSAVTFSGPSVLPPLAVPPMLLITPWLFSCTTLISLHCLLQKDWELSEDRDSVLTPVPSTEPFICIAPLNFHSHQLSEILISSPLCRCGEWGSESLAMWLRSHNQQAAELEVTLNLNLVQGVCC